MEKELVEAILDDFTEVIDILEGILAKLEGLFEIK